MYILKIKGQDNIKVKKAYDFISVSALVNSKDTGII